MAHPIRRVLVIHNPVAGRRKRKRLREFLRILDERGHRTRICLTKKPGDACDVARTTFDVDVIVCAGGDGTVNEVVNGLVARPERLPLPTLAFLPLGTANVLAWELDLPARKAKKMVKQIENNRVLTVRPGVANGQRFFLMASVGLDARAVAAVRPGTKRLFGGGAYVMAAVKALAQPSPSYTVTVDGKSYQAATVIVARAKHYGGPFVLTPDAGIERNSLTILMIISMDWSPRSVMVRLSSRDPLARTKTFKSQLVMPFTSMGLWLTQFKWMVTLKDSYLWR